MSASASRNLYRFKCGFDCESQNCLVAKIYKLQKFPPRSRTFHQLLQVGSSLTSNISEDRFKMPLSPTYLKSHIIETRIAPGAHQVELFLDYNCLFSAKLFLNFKQNFIPLIEKKHPERFTFNFINVVQPWHPNSTLLHEVALAVAKIQPSKFIEFSELLFERKEDFFDTATLNETRNEIYERLASLAEEKLGISSLEILKLVKITPVGKGEANLNSGNEVTKDVKYFTRYTRTVGVHVTPTIFIDGIKNDSVESSTSIDKLTEIFESYLQ